MRRRTKDAPIGGASFCSLASSSAYSAGIASGMVDRSCATFISGPLRPPNALVSATALAASPSPPKNRDPAILAATPPTLAPTRA